MDVQATVEINVLVLLLICVLAYVGLGVISRKFMPKLRYWAVVDPSDSNKVVNLHNNKESAEHFLEYSVRFDNGEKLYLVELVGILRNE